MNRDSFLAYAQLLRIPNVFTALADIALGAAVAVTMLPSLPAGYLGATVLVALASCSLYLAGMVWNDVFDRFDDARTRPFRPIPSGRVPVRVAIVLGVALLAAGSGFAALAGMPGREWWAHEPLAYAVGIAVAILLYDGGLKRTSLGPVAMATCRFLNILLGLSLLPDDVLDAALRVDLAAIVGIYIVGVTWFARTEEGPSSRRQLAGAAVVMGLALVLALVIRAKLPPSGGTVLFPYLVVAFGFIVGMPVTRAIANPGPREVQTAVKRCVLGLVGLDAVLASAFAGVPSLAILLLLPPALALGKWVYST